MGASSWASASTATAWAPWTITGLQLDQRERKLAGARWASRAIGSAGIGGGRREGGEGEEGGREGGEGEGGFAEVSEGGGGGGEGGPGEGESSPVGREIGRDCGVAAGARHHGHAGRPGIAGDGRGLAAPGRVARRRPPPPRPLRAPRVRRSACALASSSRSCGSSAQAAPSSSNRARNTRWSPASAPVWATAAAAPAARAAGLEHGDADVRRRGLLQRRAPARAVTVGLEVERDGADTSTRAEGFEEVGRVEDRLVAAGDDRVQPQPAPRGERVDRDVPGLRDQRDRAGLARLDRVAPERDAVRQRDDPVPVRAAHGSPFRRAASARLQLGLARLGEPRREHDRSAAAQRPARATIVWRVGGRDRHHDRVRCLRQVLERRDTRARRARRRASGSPRNAPAEPEPLQVQERLSPVGAGPLGGADHRDRPRASSRRRFGGPS